MGHPRPLFVYFQSFHANINTIVQQMKVKKCPSSKQHWDSNPRPSECESPPITTRPGLPTDSYLHFPLHSTTLSYLRFDLYVVILSLFWLAHAKIFLSFFLSFFLSLFTNILCFSFVRVHAFLLHSWAAFFVDFWAGASTFRDINIVELSLL